MFYIYRYLIHVYVIFGLQIQLLTTIKHNLCECYVLQEKPTTHQSCDVPAQTFGTPGRVPAPGRPGARSAMAPEGQLAPRWRSRSLAGQWELEQGGSKC